MDQSLRIVKKMSMCLSTYPVLHEGLIHKHIPCDAIYSVEFEGHTLYSLAHTNPAKNQRTLDNGMKSIETELDPSGMVAHLQCIGDVLSKKAKTFTAGEHVSSKYYRAIFSNTTAGGRGEKTVNPGVRVWYPTSNAADNKRKRDEVVPDVGCDDSQPKATKQKRTAVPSSAVEANITKQTRVEAADGGYAVEPKAAKQKKADDLNTSDLEANLKFQATIRELRSKIAELQRRPPPNDQEELQRLRALVKDLFARIDTAKETDRLSQVTIRELNRQLTEMRRRLEEGSRESKDQEELLRLRALSKDLWARIATAKETDKQSQSTIGELKRQLADNIRQVQQEKRTYVEYRDKIPELWGIIRELKAKMAALEATAREPPDPDEKVGTDRLLVLLALTWRLNMQATLDEVRARIRGEAKHAMEAAKAAWRKDERSYLDNIADLMRRVNEAKAIEQQSQVNIRWFKSQVAESAMRVTQAEKTYVEYRDKVTELKMKIATSSLAVQSKDIKSTEYDAKMSEIIRHQSTNRC